jgi:hypothetical protein
MKKDTKYLTQMKELPPETEEINESPVKPDKELTGMSDETSQAKQKDEAPTVKKNQESDKESVSDIDEYGSVDTEKKSLLSSRDIILGIVNLISLALLVFILFQLPKRAEELKGLRTEEFLTSSNTSSELDGITRELEKSNEIKKMFLDEAGLVGFVNEVEKLKGEGSSVQRVSFAGQLAIKDRTGNYGIPVVIDLVGDWQTIDKDLQRVDNLPFLYRAAKVNIERSELSPGVIEFKYGMFLYVDEKISTK